MAQDTFSKHFWEEFLDKERSTFSRYAFAVVVSILSLFMVYLLLRLEGTPLTSLALMSVIVSAIYGGRGPALLDTLITSVGVDYFFVAPYNELLFSTLSIIRLLTYLTLGFLVGSVVDSLRGNLIILKDQKKQLQFEKRARENILGIVSHDLRSPLSAIQMNADFLLKTLPTETERSVIQKVFNIRSSCTRMKRQIEDLLDAVKIESGQFKVSMQATVINNIISAALEESSKAALEKKVKLVLDMKADPNSQISCDSVRVIQVLNNLLGNAVKFSPENGEIQIKVESSSSDIKISIQDSGPGIPEEYQLRLFDRFWQSEENAHKGTGLGLYISRQIIEAHGGKLGVVSELGKGSLFYISLPVSI